jgi:ATP-dependent DNA helicase RecG
MTWTHDQSRNQGDDHGNDKGFEYQSVQVLKGVGPAVASKLENLGIFCIQDVLFHLPLRYEDRTQIMPVGGLQPGQQAVIEGVIEHSEVRFSGRRRSKKGSGRSLLCYLSDGTGEILLRFFHFSSAQQANLGQGVRLRCFGEVRAGARKLEMTHPEYRRISEGEDCSIEETLTPVYPKSEGIHQTLLRNIAKQAIARLNNESLPDWLPDVCVSNTELPDLLTALQTVHNPPPDVSLELMEDCSHPAQQRLIFEELLSHGLCMLQLRERIRRTRARPGVIDESTLNSFIGKLGFELTGAQKKVIREIQADLKKDVPMLRLLQGDVGSGKTVVAACAVLAPVSNGFQAAVMAPTEILADQLFENLSRWFGADKCLHLSGKHKGKVRERKLRDIHNGTASIVIGTHALFQSDVEFKNLALVVIDEQHRFGVHQRLALREKGKKESCVPHQLIMTATPIPRSLAMTAYADLDCSVIDELPEGRKPVSTVVVSESRRQEVVDRVASACVQGEQAYWVCTLVEESELLQCQAAEATATQLRDELRTLSIGLVHGRMKQDEKEEVVARFKTGGIDLLVATTVIEVGVDVPNASLMVIENAERLGLAQLHQLRGRVGRSKKQCACVLMYHPPLSQRGKERLGILRETNSGFEIARKDLHMRGPGEVLGTRQTGLIEMHIADIVRDERLLEEVNKVSCAIQERYPECIAPLIERWLGSADRFASV